MSTAVLLEKVEDQGPGISRLNHSAVEPRSANRRFDLTLGHDSFYATSRSVHGMRERPINSFGLARADQGHPRSLKVRLRAA